MQKKYSNYQPLWVIFLLSLFALGIYNIIWLFKTRLQIRAVVEKKLPIWPLCVPIFNIIPIVDVFVKDSDLLQAKTTIEKKGAHNGMKAVLFIIMFLLWIAFFVVGILAAFDPGSIAGIIITTVVGTFFVINAQEYLNYYWRDLQKDLPERKRFTKKEYYILGFGLLFCVFVFSAKTIFMSEIKKLTPIRDQHFNAQEYDKALEYTQEMLAIAEGKGDEAQKLNEWNNLSLIYKETGRTEESLSLITEALSLANELNDNNVSYILYQRLYEIYSERNERETALLLSAKHIKHIDRRMYRMVMSELSSMQHGITSKYDRLFERAQPGGHSIEITANAYTFASEEHPQYALRWDLALQKYLEAAGAFRTEGDYAKEAEMFYKAGDIYLIHKNNIPMALENFKLAMEVPLEDRVGPHFEKMSISTFISDGLHVNKEYLLESISESLSGANLGDHDCETMFKYIAPEENSLSFSEAIAACAFVHDDETSLRWYRKSMQQFSSLPNSEKYKNPELRIAIMLILKGDIETAKEYTSDKEALMKKIFKYSDEKENDSAKIILINALKIFDTPSEQIGIYNKLGELSEFPHESVAREYYQKALKIAQKGKDNRAEQSILESLKFLDDLYGR